MTADYDALIAAGEVWVIREGGRRLGRARAAAAAARAARRERRRAPDRQGAGLGRALMAFADDHARAAGLAEVMLYTNERMTENLRFYPALGFTETGRGMQDGFARVFYRKPLGD